jgi:hypothetical protein
VFGNDLEVVILKAESVSGTNGIRQKQDSHLTCIYIEMLCRFVSGPYDLWFLTNHNDCGVDLAPVAHLLGRSGPS